MSLERDPVSKMIINTDDSHYRAILAAREAEKEAREAREKVDQLQSIITEFKDIKLELEELIAGIKNGKTGS